MSRAIAAPAATDMRVGVTAIEHEALDHAEVVMGRFQKSGLYGGLASGLALSEAHKAAAAAFRARPEIGKAGKRRLKAIEATAFLLVALRLIENDR